MKKELKRISLHKEVLVNLNSPEMDSIKGGSSVACGAKAVSVLVTTKVFDQMYDHYVSSYVESALDAIDSYASQAWDWLTGSGEEDEDETIYDGGTLPEVIVTP